MENASDVASREFGVALTRFCRTVIVNNALPYAVNPSVVAAHFVKAFQIPCPMTFYDASVLLFRLARPEVYFKPGMEEQAQIRGRWASNGELVKIYVDPDRPLPSCIKTLLHEIAELILEISYELRPPLTKFTDRERERWANRFAHMVKMSPNDFEEQAEQCGLDLRHLAEIYKDTLAGVSRQVRDLNAYSIPYYVCRVDIERNPHKNCPLLLATLQESGGVPVRVADVARTSHVQIARRRSGALPTYNLPAIDHYRVMHPAFWKYINTNEAVYIPSLHGGAAFEGGWSDLFGEQDLAVLVRPYGIRKVRGFYLLAIPPSEACRIQNQLTTLGPEKNCQIGWLFSWTSYSKNRRPQKPIQPGLPIVDETGEIIDDLAKMSYPWPQVDPESNWNVGMFESEDQPQASDEEDEF